MTDDFEIFEEINRLRRQIEDELEGLSERQQMRYLLKKAAIQKL